MDRHERTRVARVEEYSEARRLALASQAKPPWKAVMITATNALGVVRAKRIVGIDRGRLLSADETKAAMGQPIDFPSEHGRRGHGSRA